MAHSSAFEEGGSLGCFVNGKGRNVLPVPGSFVIDQDGVVRAMQAETDYKTRMEPATIIDALKKLSK